MTLPTEHGVVCPHCAHVWRYPEGDYWIDGGRILVDDVPLEEVERILRSFVIIATAAAAHMRQDHGDEDAATALERWAIHDLRSV